jgi:CysZ protein
MKDFLDGITSYGKAFNYLFKSNIWIYAIIPGVIGIFLSGLTLWTVLTFSDDLGNWIVHKFNIDPGKEVITRASHWVAGLLMGSFSILLFKYVILIISAPFMSPLSEKIEAMELGYKKRSGFSVTQMLEDLVRGIRINLRNIVRELFFMFILILLGLIPIFSTITPILIYVVQSFYAGFGNMDYTLERYFGVRGSVQFVRQHKLLALGNGLIFMLVLSIPFIGVLIIIPISTIASTIESVKRLNPKSELV